MSESVAMISLLTCMLLVYGKATDFCKLILNPIGII